MSRSDWRRLVIASLFMVGGLVLLPISAGAASFSCEAAATKLEKAICADSALSSADDRLAQAYAAALLAADDPDSVIADQRSWVTQRNKAALGDLAALYSARIATLEAMAARPLSPENANLAKTCLRVPTLDKGLACNVDESGGVVGSQGRLRYQIQDYLDDGTRSAGGVAVVTPDAGGGWTIIAATGDDSAHYEAPRVITNRFGTLLSLRGSLEGTGFLSAEALFVLRDGAWKKIDLDGWQKALAASVPKGLAAWKGIYPDWRAMTASTPLWREDKDGNCCPSGGRANVRLRLIGERLEIESIQVRLGAAAASAE